MKKSGFTLIEVVVAIAITLILMSLTLKASKLTGEIINSIKTESVLYDVSNLISFGKHYCTTNEKKGLLEISKSTSVIRFKDETISGAKGVIRTIRLPSGYTFLENFTISINVNGVVSAGKIEIKDLAGKYHKITIGVGVDTVSIYE